MGLRKRRQEEAPVNVRIKCPDGRDIPCGVLRDPDGDENGCAMWVAVPLEPLTLTEIPGWAILADALPGKTILGLQLPLTD
jgi:hypothetical protein